MAQGNAKRAGTTIGKACSVAALGLLAGGCAQVGGLPGMMSSNPGEGAVTANASQVSKDELATATTYWGKKFSENPTKLDAALAYAKNLKAMGHKRQAMAVLQQSAVYHGDNRKLAGEYGRLALDLGQIKVAEKVLAQADSPTDPDWRIISARGTVLAKQGRYQASVPYYERALTLAPNHPSILNNLAMAHAMGGNPVKAEELLRQAVQQGGNTKRVRQNLALVLGLQGRYSESAKVGAQDQPIQSAASDTAALRKLVKLDPVAAPANAGGTQLAGASSLRGTNAEAGSTAGGWSTAVAEAQ
ncbi:MAG: tetratricopeptide repeat protein [Filomicrobium sp.]